MAAGERVLRPGEAPLSAGDYLRAGGQSLAFTTDRQLVLHDITKSAGRLLWDGSGLEGPLTLRLEDDMLIARDSQERTHEVSRRASGRNVSLVLDDAGQLSFATDLAVLETYEPVRSFVAPELALVPVPQEPLGWWDRLSRPMKAHPQISAAVSAVLLVTGFVLASGVFSRDLDLNWPAPSVVKVVVVILLLLGAAVWATLQRTGGPAVLACTIGVALLLLFATLTLSVTFETPEGSANEKAEIEATQQAVAGAHAQTFAIICLGFAVLTVMYLLPRTGKATLGQVLSPATTSASTVLVLWTFVTVYAVALIGGFQALKPMSSFSCDGDTARYCVNGDAFDYLILLGVPGAAAALTKRSPDPEPIEPGSVSEMGVNQVSEAQYFLFNAIAMAFVAFSLLQDLHRLPQLPDLLIALTGASALAYTLEKRKP